MNNKTQITVSELNQVLSSLKQQQSELSTVYNSNIKKVLESSSSCLMVAGLNYDEILSSFSTTFTNLDTAFTNLINVLQNDVIKNYSETALVIRQMFNNEFASQLSELLNISKK